MNSKFLNFLAYTALIITGLLMFVNVFIPLVGIKIEGPLLSIFDFAKDMLVLIVMGAAAYRFTVGSKKWIKILFWISVIIFVTATVLKFV